jgi:hypothetical protein
MEEAEEMSFFNVDADALSCDRRNPKRNGAGREFEQERRWNGRALMGGLMRVSDTTGQGIGWR